MKLTRTLADINERLARIEAMFAFGMGADGLKAFEKANPPSKRLDRHSLKSYSTPEPEGAPAAQGKKPLNKAEAKAAASKAKEDAEAAEKAAAEKRAAEEAEAKAKAEADAKAK